MIEAGAVGATFTILDEASPVLRRIAEQLDRLDASIARTKASLRELSIPPGVSRSLTGIADRFASVTNASKASADAIGVSFGRMDAAIVATSARIAALSGELKGLAAESRAIGGAPSIRYGAHVGGPALAAGGGGGGPGAGGGVHFGGASVPLPGDQHMRLSGGPALAAGGAVAYGTYEEAKIQDFVNRIFLTGGISTGRETNNPLYGKIRDAILHAYTMTGLPLEQIEEGILTGTRGLAGVDLEKRLNLMPSLLAASATEAYLKDGTTIPEAMQAFVGLAHMQGKYDPDQIAKLADHFAYLSTTTPVSVEQIERAASYAIPMLRTADFDPDQLLLMITSMERAGITNTKAGTWISQLATQSFPGTSLMSKMLFKKHEAALKDLHLIDDKDQPTWFTDGKPDLVKMTSIAGDAIQKMDPAHRLAIEKALWGQQGGRAAGFFADPTNQQIMGRVAEDEKNFVSGEKMWEQSQANSPIVQFRTAFAELNEQLINLGSNVLPFVTGALKGGNETLGGKGELALGGAALAGWLLKTPIWEGLKKVGAKILDVVPAAGSLPALIDAATNPDARTPQAKANDDAVLAKLRQWFAPPSAPPGNGPANRLTRSALPYLDRADLQGVGAEPVKVPVYPDAKAGSAKPLGIESPTYNARESAAYRPSAPPVNATLKADVATQVHFTATMDSQTVVSIILPKIVQAIQSEMHSAMSALEGIHNDIAHRMAPGWTN